MMHRARRRGDKPPLPIAALAFVCALFLLLPLVALVLRAPWGRLVEEFARPEIRAALLLSLRVSLAATFLSLLLGVPLAWLLARWDFPGRSFVRGVALLPLVLPPVVGGVALLLVLGRRGLVGGLLEDLFGIRLFGTTAGVVVAETFVALPFLILTVEAALRSLDIRYEDAAATLGASAWTVFRRITLPAVLPALGAGAVLAWARALGEFGATITFAGNLPGRTQTIPLAVYVELQRGLDGAIALSLVLVVISLTVIVAMRDRLVSSP
ncbi:MAG: molybdate ABC transporter permease subunit [Actinobacteria bacterium]|nr:molybdate ABC transporter permease subunit [Actinomycetota bacterium]